MKEFLEKIKAFIAIETQKAKDFYLKNRLVVLGGATALGILLIVWARFGFTLQVSRFFAAVPPPTVVMNSGYGPYKHGERLDVAWSATGSLRCLSSSWIDTGGKNEGRAYSDPIDACAASGGSFGITCYYAGGDQATTPVNFSIDQSTCPSTSTPTPQTTSSPSPSPSTCGATIPNGGSLDWSVLYSEPWDDCVEGQSNASPSQFWVKATVGTCHPDNLHLVWRAQHRPKATCAMKDVPIDKEYSEGQGITTSVNNFTDMNLPNGQGGSAQMAYTTSTTNCGSIDMMGAFQADDGSATYPHNNTGNAGWHKIINYGVDCGAATPTSVPTSTPTPSVSRTPTPTLTPTPSPTPVITATVTPSSSPSQAAMVMSVTGRNVSTNSGEATTVTALPNQQVQVKGRINSAGAAALIGVVLQSSITDGLTYIPGTLMVNGVRIDDNYNSAVVGNMGPGQTALVQFNVRINSSVPVGLTQAIVSMESRATNSTSKSGYLTIAINRGTHVGTVKTGPGDAVLVALLISGIVSLLYVSYTHTSMFRRHEVDSIARKRDPLDFRS